MKEMGTSYWGVDFTAPVKYDVVQMDPGFMAHAKRSYGSEKKFLDSVARVITLTPTDSTVHSHPTGGRAGVYDLPHPYQDPLTKLPCYEVDVKGIGLTKSGYVLFHDEFRQPSPRREVMIHNRRNEAFGVDSLVHETTDATNIRQVRKTGIATPIPAAVLRLRELSVNGEIVPIEEARRHYGLEKNMDMGLFVRAYPLSSTRVSDLAPSVDCEPPPLHRIERETYVNLEGTVLRQVLNWRRTWQQSEKARIMRNGQEHFFRKQGNGHADRGYFLWYMNQEYHQLATMIQRGISPPTGKESSNQSLRHSHIQNGTTAGVSVEWAPITDISRLPAPQRLEHIRALLDDAHKRVTICGAAVLPDFTAIPTFQQFIHHISEITDSSELHQLKKATTRLTESEIEAKKTQGEKVILLQSYGSMDPLIELLRDHQKPILMGQITLPAQTQSPLLRPQW